MTKEQLATYEVAFDNAFKLAREHAKARKTYLGPDEVEAVVIDWEPFQREMKVHLLEIRCAVLEAMVGGK